MGIFKENIVAIRFLLVFIGLYFILNTAYGFYIEHYFPEPDPVTVVVSSQVASVLSILVDESIVYRVVEGSRNVLIGNSQRIVISVFEGCNSINVMIVFLSFIIAFRGNLKSTIWFSTIGLLIIYLMNLTRVGMLYLVGVYFPQHMYYIHKYFFTGFIYAVVFLMWYLWVKRVRVEVH